MSDSTLTIDELWDDEPSPLEAPTNDRVRVVIAAHALEIRLLDAVGEPMPDAAWRVLHREQLVAEDIADGDGVAHVRITKSYRLVRDPWITIQWGHPQSGDVLHYAQRVLVGHERLEGDAALTQKLAHLGWKGDASEIATEFQRHFGQDVTAQPHDIEALVDDLHDNGVAPQPKQDAKDHVLAKRELDEQQGNEHTEDDLCGEPEGTA